MANKKEKKCEILRLYFTNNITKYLQETTLHGLKYLADSSLTIWEKLFFFTSLVAAFIIVVNLISNVYAMWESTPVIIGVSPQPTSIFKVPFPAVTFCNINQALNSKVANYTEDSLESELLRFLCRSGTDYDDLVSTKQTSVNNLGIVDFITKHSQPCSRMLLYCQISSIQFNCSDIFREVITDEGLCCAFNSLHPDFLYKGKHLITKDLTNTRETEAINWNHEHGFPSKLPKRYYPMTASDTGISMGMTIILNAELDEYYCSSINGPGIKVALQNPIEVPFVKETGITVPLGYETRFRINAKYSEAASDLRSMHRNRRQCMFINEENLLYYKYYTINNCEIECHASYLNKKCGCIPFQYPLIYSNSTVCTVNATNCINNAKRDWTMQLSDELCLKRCLPNCFDLTFLPDAFSSRLAEGNYLIQNSLLQYMNKDQMKNNIAIVHFYYRETVFYGDLKNVYIGFIEFLSNIGGIMGLFMGFSFISVAEILYFIALKPISHFVLLKKS